MKNFSLVYKSGFVLAVAISAFLIGSNSERQRNRQSQFNAEGKKPSVSRSASLATEDSSNTSAALGIKDIFGNPGAMDRTYLFDKFLERMSSENALIVLEELGSLRPSQKRSRMIGQFFEKWGELSGELALAHAMNHKGYDGMLYQSSAIEGWASNQPIEAWDSLMALSNNGSIHFPRTNATLARIAEKNLNLAVGLATQVENPMRQHMLFQPIVEIAANSNQLPELLNTVGQIADKKQQEDFLQTLFKDWGQIDNAGSIEAANKLGDEGMVVAATKGLMRGWASNDGKSALEYAIQNSSDPLFKEIAVSVATDWARYANSTEIADLIRTIENAENRAQILDGVIHPLSRADPSRALELIEKLEDVQAKGKNTAMVLWNMGKTDHAAAEAYFRSVPDDQVRIQSTYAITNSAIAAGKSAEETLSILDAFSDEKAQLSALSTMAYAATQSQNLTKTVDLRDQLYERLEAAVEFDPDAKQQLLDKLRPIKDPPEIPE